MGIEAGRDQQQLRGETLQLRQDAPLESAAKRRAIGTGRQRLIDDVAGDAALLPRTAAGIKRHLMAGGIEQIGVIGEGNLGAVAVMDIKIHHGDAFDAMPGAGVLCRDGDIVEQAETHRPLRFGMMSRRAHGAEEMLAFAGHKGVHGGDGGTGGMQGGFSGLRRKAGVGIHQFHALGGNARENVPHHRLGMHALQILLAGARGLAAGNVGKGRCVKAAQYRLQPLRALRMPFGHLMLATRGMGEHNGSHGVTIQSILMRSRQKIIKSGKLALLEANAANIERAVQALAEGRLVAFPTETVYGLGADAGNDEAVARIFAAKGRPVFNPLIIHVASAEAAFALGCANATARRLANRFWPGGMSLVLRRRAAAPVAPLATAGLETIALRVPSHPVAQALLRAWGGAIAAPSANVSGRLSPTCAEHVIAGMGDADIACILDGGAATLGLESSVIGCPQDGDAVLLRPGGIAGEEMEALLGAPLRVAEAGADGEMARGSPGRLLRHYAPRAALRLQAREVREGELLLAFGADAPRGARFCLNLSAKGCLREAAANLFSHLARLDAEAARSFSGGGFPPHPPHGASKARRRATIAVMPIPEYGLGLAINDRLRRGARAQREDNAP